MDEQQLAELAKRVYQALRARNEWLTYGQLAHRVLGNREEAHWIEAAVLLCPRLFAQHQECRVKLSNPELYRLEFDRATESANAGEATRLKNFWVYVAEWDVYGPGSGPYRTVVHRESCTKVQGRKHKEEGIGYKNYWWSFYTEAEAIEFASTLHPWERCSFCFKPD